MVIDYGYIFLKDECKLCSINIDTFYIIVHKIILNIHVSDICAKLAYIQFKKK